MNKFVPNVEVTAVRFVGKHHSDCIKTFAKYIKEYNENSENKLFGKLNAADFIKIQGFVTDEGKFVDRQTAYNIAFENDQIVPEGIRDDGILFSEFLK